MQGWQHHRPKPTFLRQMLLHPEEARALKNLDQAITAKRASGPVLTEALRPEWRAGSTSIGQQHSTTMP